MTTAVGNRLRKVFDSVADAKSANFLKVGDKVETLGYDSPNDGGGATYVVESVTPDVTLELINKTRVSLKVFGTSSEVINEALSMDLPVGVQIYFKGEESEGDGKGGLYYVSGVATPSEFDIQLDNGKLLKPCVETVNIAGRFRGTMNDDKGSPDAVFAVERVQGGENSPHSFRDNSDWYPEGTGEPAFASYDADADIYNEVVTDHFIDFQARGRKFGSGIMRTMWGFASINRVDAGHVNKATAFDNKFRISPEATCTTYTSFQSEPAVYGDTGTITHFQVRAGFTLPETTVGSETGLFIKAMQFAPVATTRPILIEPQREGVKNLISCETEFTRDQEVTDKDYGFVIRSPNNSRWRITVDNSGNLSATAL